MIPPEAGTGIVTFKGRPLLLSVGRYVLYFASEGLNLTGGGGYFQV
jgi:hypothetical protein